MSGVGGIWVGPYEQTLLSICSTGCLGAHQEVVLWMSCSCHFFSVEMTFLLYCLGADVVLACLVDYRSISF